jgi:hypothetical protein
MRVSIVPILLAGGLLALGACSASVEPVNLTLAERAEQCSADSELVPTGSQTGDPRRDYRCMSSGHTRGNARESAGVVGYGAQTSVRSRPST